jgi:hypothetical protein
VLRPGAAVSSQNDDDNEDGNISAAAAGAEEAAPRARSSAAAESEAAGARVPPPRRRGPSSCLDAGITKKCACGETSGYPNKLEQKMSVIYAAASARSPLVFSAKERFQQCRQATGSDAIQIFEDWERIRNKTTSLGALARWSSSVAK